MYLVLIALAVVAGVDRRRVALLVVCLYLPWLLAGVIVYLISLRSRDRVNRAALFCDGVASELRSGSSLRHAVAAAATAVEAHSLAAESGSVGPTQLGGLVAAQFPVIGRELALTVTRAARTGGSAADLFDEIGSLAIAHEEIRREISMASAPARAAAGMFVGAPLIYLGWRWGSGDIAAILSSPEQRTIAGGGLGLFLSGLLGAGIVMWRAR